MPPCCTSVPAPVRVKKAGMPAPAARIRSAIVPIGTSSTSISPFRYCSSNSEFSPTYEPTILPICLVWKSTPSPRSSVPTLLETTVRFFEPRSRTASSRFSGTPVSPKPPTSSVLSDSMSWQAAAADSKTLGELKLARPRSLAAGRALRSSVAGRIAAEC